jgi:D-inositol-3-phosphate glycosyltransferase
VPRPGEYPKRVAMVSMHTSPLEPPGLGDAGGLNVYVSELARRLGERGVTIDVLTRQTDPAADVVEINEWVRVVPVPAGPPAPLPKEELPGLAGCFADALADRVDCYDLVHTHYWLSGMVGLELKRRDGIPLVHTMHTMARVKNSFRGPDDGHEPLDREHGEAAIVARADGLTANTVDEAEDLRRLYGADPDIITVVPPGVDLHTFHPCNQARWRTLFDLPVDAQVIVFVGRVQPLKAPDVLIRAVAELVQDDPVRRSALRLVIIGSPSGPDQAWARSLPDLADRLGVRDLVEFRPHSARPELFRWYCASNVVAVPSFSESFGLVALEAQACGRPVVAKDVGGLRHAVDDGQTGLLVHTHDPVEWAKALAVVLDDAEEAARLGTNGAVHASRFSWDNSAAETLLAYHRALHH